MQLVKAYGAEERETERLSTIAGRLRDARIERRRGCAARSRRCSTCCPSLTNVGLVVLGAYRVRSGDLTVGELSSFVYLFTLLVFPLRLIGYALSELPHSLAGWDRVREVLDEPIEPDPRAAIDVAPRRVAASQLDDVGVHVPRRDRAGAATTSSLDVAAGRIVAVVGPTGAGKTTLVELVAGLVAPDDGHRRASAPGPRAIVFQEAFLFAGTIRAQRRARRRRSATTRCGTALRLARADDFVAETAARPRHRRRRARRQPQRRPAPAHRPRPGARPPPGAAAARRHDVGARPGHRGAPCSANLRGALAGTTVLMVASRPSTIALADEVVYLAGGQRRRPRHARRADGRGGRLPRRSSRRSRPTAPTTPSTPSAAARGWRR